MHRFLLIQIVHTTKYNLAGLKENAIIFCKPVKHGDTNTRQKVITLNDHRPSPLFNQSLPRLPHLLQFANTIYSVRTAETCYSVKGYIYVQIYIHMFLYISYITYIYMYLIYLLYIYISYIRYIIYKIYMCIHMFLYIFMIYIRTNKQEKLYTFKIVFRNFL